MKRKLLFVAAIAASALGMRAQTDVTSTYLTNAGFDAEDDFQTENLTVNPVAIKSVTEWTSNASSSWAASGCIQFGGSGQINGTSIPSTNSDGEATGGAVALTGAWDDGSGYASYTQEVTLPAGHYQIDFKVNNVGQNNNFRTSLFGFTTTAKNYYGTITSYPQNTWTTETVSFDLAEETTGNVSIGFGWKHAGSGSTPKLVVDYVKIYYTDPEAAEKAAQLEAAKSTLNGYIKKATALNGVLSDATLTTAIESAQDVYDNADDYADDYDNVVSEASELSSAITTTLDLITAISLNNSGFDVEEDWATENIAAGASANSKDVSEWTSNGGAGWCSSAAFAYGGSGQINGVDIPASDMFGNSDGGMLGFSLGWGSTIKYSQTISGKLPAGKYLLYYEAYNGNTASSVVGTNLIGLSGTNSQATDFGKNTWNAYAMQIELTAAVTDAELVVGATGVSDTGSGGSAKFVIDNVALYQIETTAIADESDYAALNEAITANESKTIGFEADEYAPYNNIGVIAALTAAKAVDQEVENTQEYVQSITSALASATWTANTEEVNAIYNGDLANSTPNETSGVDVDVPGWTLVQGMRLVVGDAETDPGLEYASAGKALFAWGGTTITYGETDGYTLPLKANTVYELTYSITGWRDGDTPTYLSLDVANASVVNSSMDDITLSGRINDAEGNPFETVNFKFTTGEAGNYIVKVYSNHHFAITDFNLIKVATTDIAGTTVTAANKYATFMSEITRNIPEGLNVYTVESVNENTLVFSEPLESIPANTPVILENTTNADVELAATTGQSLAIEDTYTSGLLTGVYADQAATVGTYVLQNQSGVVGFYKVGEEKIPTVTANHAYMTYEAPAAEEGAKAFFFPAGEATAIEAISALANGEIEGIYTIGGAKLNSLQKGINIVKMQNGTTQKVLVK